MAKVQVRAAGGVLWRDHDGIEVVVVHRPRYGDWSFPKGKCETGEGEQDCARREVSEETGLKGELGAELTAVRYEDRHGQTKQVRYWAMSPTAAARGWDDEVDLVCWLPLDRAAQLLSYKRDLVVLNSFRALADK